LGELRTYRAKLISFRKGRKKMKKAADQELKQYARRKRGPLERRVKQNLPRRVGLRQVECASLISKGDGRKTAIIQVRGGEQERTFGLNLLRRRHGRAKGKKNGEPPSKRKGKKILSRREARNLNGGAGERKTRETSKDN